MRFVLKPGVCDLVRELGEDAITVELTVDFESDGRKSAVAYAGPSEGVPGFEHILVGGLHVWWRQRLILGSGVTRTAPWIRPRRVLVGRQGRALHAAAEYA